MNGFNLDNILADLIIGKHLAESILSELFSKLREVLVEEENVLEVPSPVIVVGDVHGQLFDVIKMFEVAESLDEYKVSGQTNFLFLGDYVDRGHFSFETFAYLAARKLKNRSQIYLLRGNHESRSINQTYGLFYESLSIYGNTSIWNLINETFDALPIAAVVNNSLFCVHGGISPEVSYVEKLNIVDRYTDIPSSGIIADLTWSDPSETQDWIKNKRGSGYCFGRTHVQKFLQQNNFKFMVRSHQLMKEGFMEHFDGKCVTVWSAPNYAYTETNKATFMAVDKDTNRVFVEFPSNKEIPYPEDDKAPCPYFA